MIPEPNSERDILIDFQDIIHCLVLFKMSVSILRQKATQLGQVSRTGPYLHTPETTQRNICKHNTNHLQVLKWKYASRRRHVSNLWNTVLNKDRVVDNVRKVAHYIKIPCHKLSDFEWSVYVWREPKNILLK